MTENIKNNKHNKNIKIIKNSKKNIIVNYSCYCNNFFNYDDEILCLNRCGHILHKDCLNEYLLKNNINKCPICKEDIIKVFNEHGVIYTIENTQSFEKSKTILLKDEYKQEKIDIQSIHFLSNSKINYFSLPLSIIKVNFLLSKFINSSSIIDYINIADTFFNLFNFKLNIIDNTKNNPINIINNKINWLNKEDNEKIILISNHSHYTDSIILYYLFQCGLIANDNINLSDIGKLVASKCNFLIFNEKTDIIQQITEYLDKIKKIIIFPEGIISNNTSLLRFRPEIFNLNTQICPIIIKWIDYVYDDDITKFIFKILTQDEIKVDIYINNIFYPPHDPEKIRNYMAKIGNLKKSRVLKNYFS
jgi:hypothetical protein